MVDQPVERVAWTAAGLGVAPGDLAGRSVWIWDKDLVAEYVAALSGAGAWDALQRSNLFPPNELRTSPVAGPTEVPADADLAEFCGHKRRKVRAALAVAAALTGRLIEAHGNVIGLDPEFELPTSDWVGAQMPRPEADLPARLLRREILREAKQEPRDDPAVADALASPAIPSPSTSSASGSPSDA